MSGLRKEFYCSGGSAAKVFLLGLASGVAVIMYITLERQLDPNTLQASVPLLNYNQFAEKFISLSRYLSPIMFFVLILGGGLGVIRLVSLKIVKQRYWLTLFCSLAIGTLATFVFLPIGYLPDEASRHDWARRTFGGFYAKAEGYLRDQSVVQQSIGAVQSISPIPGINRVIHHDVSSQAVFSVRLIGERGDAQARVYVLHGLDRVWELSGTVKINGNEIVLSQLTSNSGIDKVL